LALLTTFFDSSPVTSRLFVLLGPDGFRQHLLVFCQGIGFAPFTASFCSQNTPGVDDSQTASMVCVTNLTPPGSGVTTLAVGNIFGRWVGSEPSLPAVGSGSHAVGGLCTS
jgi:hypothetical protein